MIKLDVPERMLTRYKDITQEMYWRALNVKYSFMEGNQKRRRQKSKSKKLEMTKKNMPLMSGFIVPNRPVADKCQFPWRCTI